MRRIVSIQYLRGIAALIVVIFHEYQSLRDYTTVNIDRFTGHFHVLGAIGVDIFFVISGFIMVVLLDRKNEAPSRRLFVLRRVIRIVPTYWLLTLVMFASRMIETALAGKTVPPEWGFLLGSLFFVPMNDASGFIYPVLSPGWTLPFEVFFYAVLVFFVGWNVRRTTVVVAMLFVGLTLAGVALRPTAPALVFLTSPLLVEFAFGMGIGLMFLDHRLLRPIWGGVCIAACFAVLALTYTVLNDNNISRLTLRGVPAALLVLGLLSQEARLRVAPWRALLMLGDASYALYLSHDFVLPAVNRIAAGRLGLPISAVAWLAVGASVVVGWGFFVAVERPLLRRLTARFNAGSRRPATSIGLAAV